MGRTPQRRRSKSLQKKERRQVNGTAKVRYTPNWFLFSYACFGMHGFGIFMDTRNIVSSAVFIGLLFPAAELSCCFENTSSGRIKRQLGVALAVLSTVLVPLTAHTGAVRGCFGLAAVCALMRVVQITRDPSHFRGSSFRHRWAFMTWVGADFRDARFLETSAANGSSTSSGSSSNSNSSSNKSTNKNSNSGSSSGSSSDDGGGSWRAVAARERFGTHATALPTAALCMAAIAVVGRVRRLDAALHAAHPHVLPAIYHLPVLHRLLLPVRWALGCGFFYNFFDFLELVYCTPPLLLDGVRFPAIMNEPFASESLAEFWGERWDVAVQGMLKGGVYEPCRQYLFPGRSRRARLCAGLTTFLASALLHLYGAFIGGASTTQCTSMLVFFCLQPLFLLLEAWLWPPLPRGRDGGTSAGASATRGAQKTEPPQQQQLQQGAGPSGDSNRQASGKRARAAVVRPTISVLGLHVDRHRLTWFAIAGCSPLFIEPFLTVVGL